NLVIYDQFSRARWATNTGGYPALRARLEPGDGILRLYNTNNQVVWIAPMSRGFNRCLLFQEDGNLVAYENNCRPIWATNTFF
ncbi:hypothetical protein HDU67_001176, partial [Dinochytrium kinnereticum]